MANAKQEDNKAVKPDAPEAEVKAAPKVKPWPGQELAEAGVEYQLPSGNTIMTPKVTPWLNS